MSSLLDNNLEVDFKSIIRRKLYNYLKDSETCDPKYHYMCRSYKEPDICLLDINDVGSDLNDYCIMYLYRNFTKETVIFRCIKNPNINSIFILKREDSGELITINHLLENY